LPAKITNPPEVTEIVLQRLIDALLWRSIRPKTAETWEEQMGKDNLAADIEKMSLSELAALEADAIQVAAGTIAPQEPNTISDTAEKRVIALKREISSH
jgi:hypothetical protein